MSFRTNAQHDAHIERLIEDGERDYATRVLGDEAPDWRRTATWVACDDCGDQMPTQWPDDSTHICPSCGDARAFKHNTGRYDDAFA